MRALAFLKRKFLSFLSKFKFRKKRPDWIEEHRFWATKAKRAFIRWDLAHRAQDLEAREVAFNEHQLYSRRMMAVVPNDVRERWENEFKDEVLAAIKEKEENA